MFLPESLIGCNSAQYIPVFPSYCSITIIYWSFLRKDPTLCMRVAPKFRYNISTIPTEPALTLRTSITTVRRPALLNQETLLNRA